MSQSNDSPAPCADMGEHGKASTSVCDALRSGAHGQRKINLATVTGRRKRNSWVWNVMQQFEPPIRKCSVRCSVEVSKDGITSTINKRLSRSVEDDCIGGGNALQRMAISDIEELGHHFVGNVAQNSSRARAPAPAPGPGLTTPAVTLPRVSSVMEQRRLARLAAAGHGSSSHGAQGGVQPVTHHVALRQELTNDRGQNVEADVCGFSLPGIWLRKSERTLAQCTGELVAPPDLPHLALLVRLYHGVEAISCEAERNFSSL